MSIDGVTVSASRSSRAIYTESGGWLWTDGFHAATTRLTAGTHTLQLQVREADVDIDKIVIAPASYSGIAIGGSGLGPTGGEPPVTTKDGDNDGVIDSLDECPTVAGPASNNGCPIVIPPNPGNAGVVVIEAESGAVSGSGAQWIKSSGVSGASGSAYMRSTGESWNKDNSATLRFTFSTDAASDSYIYIRKAGSGNSLWMTLDGKAISAIPTTQALYLRPQGWVWSNGFNAARAKIPAGDHTLELHVRNRNVLIDKIIIASTDSNVIAAGSTEKGPDGPTTPPTPDPPKPKPPGSSHTVSDFSRFPGETNHSLPVTLPACDANAVRINTPSELRLLESSNARVFCIAPGDYRSAGAQGPIIIKGKHGSADAPKVIQLDNSSLNFNDVIFDLSTSKLALLPAISFVDSSHWIVDRMAFINVNQYQTRVTAIELHASPDIILSRLRIEKNANSVSFYHLSHRSVLQNSLIGRSAGLIPDSVCIGLVGGLVFSGSDSSRKLNEPSNGASRIFNAGIYNNEIVNCNDGIMLFWDPRERTRESHIYNSPSYWPDYQGTVIAGNDIYIDSSLRTNCYGAPSTTGICARAENAIDLKAGSKNATKPVRITDNRMWGFRKADGTSLSDQGVALSLHFIATKNIEISENVIWDSGSGIGITRGVSAVTIHNNILHKMFYDGGRRPIYGNTGLPFAIGDLEPYFGATRDIEISENHVVDSGGPWIIVNQVPNATVDCNVVIAGSASDAWFNTRKNTNARIGKNSLYGGVRGYNLEPAGSVLRSSKAAAKMVGKCFRVGVASRSGGQQVCLDRVLSTRSSPHACDSETWRNY